MITTTDRRRGSHGEPRGRDGEPTAGQPERQRRSAQSAAPAVRARTGGTGREAPTGPSRALVGQQTLAARRSPLMVAVGLLLACLGGLGGAWAWQNASHAESVVVMASDVGRGQVVKRSDLAIASVSVAPGVTRTPADQLTDLVGRTALVDLPRGSLPGVESVGRAVVAPGRSQIGLRLGPGKVPATDLPAGTKVTLIEISPEAGAAPQPSARPLLAVAGVVTGSPRMIDGGAERLVDVEVASDHAADLADLAARDRVALVREAP